MGAEGKSFLEGVVRNHGHVSDAHRVLAEHDVDFLRAFDAVVDIAERQPRRLPRLTKELVTVAVLAAIGAPRDQLRAHMMASSSEGATSADLLELLELVLAPAGMARFAEAVEVWKQVFDF